MTESERVTYEQAIQKYNRKGCKSSLEAILLHRAWEVISYYKMQSNRLLQARVVNTELGTEVGVCHSLIQELREKIEHLEEQLNPKL